MRNGFARIPRLTASFAYFLGYLLGDGCTSVGQIVAMSCHSIDEEHFCKSVLVPLIARLFGVRLTPYKDIKLNAYHINFGSKKLVAYLTNEVGFPPGQARKSVPKLIQHAPRRLRVAFVRGFFDADGSLIFSKKTYGNHVYPSIELKSVDREILEWVMGVLEELSFRASLGRSVESWVLRINGADMLNRWMEMIGSSNLKHISKYQVWQKYGYCPPNTSVPQRLGLLHSK